MKITLVNEGTYPYATGGTCEWNHSLISGLPEVDFSLLAIAANENNERRWLRQPNVVEEETITIWPLEVRRKRGKRDSEVLDALRDFYLQLTYKTLDVEAASKALRRVRHFGLDRVKRTFNSEAAIEMLQSVWRDVHGVDSLSIRDLLYINDAIDHSLRPLFWKPNDSDLNHAVANGLAVLPCLAALWDKGTPYLLSEHGVYLRERYLDGWIATSSGAMARFVILRFFRAITTIGYTYAARIVPVSRFNQRWSLREGVPSSKIHTIYNGVDTLKYSFIASEPEVKTVGWVGGINPVKDLETLIRAFAIVQEENPGARLKIFGAASAGCHAYAKKCEALAAQILTSGSFEFAGAIPESRVGFEQCHVMASSSISEGMPYSLLEAMMSGRATVSTNVGGVSEAVGRCGVLVNPQDPQTMAAELSALLRDDDRRRALGRAARVRALKYFRLVRMLSDYKALYSHALAPASSPDLPEFENHAEILSLDGRLSEVESRSKIGRLIASERLSS